MQLQLTTHRSGQAGMTLIEILTVAGIIGLLAAMAMPFFIKARQASEDSTFMSDMRVVVSGMVTYSVNHNSSYPAEVGPAQAPAGTADFFNRRFDWAAKTPIGGQWDWDRDVYGAKAAVSVIGPARTTQQMQKIDAQIDDGNLSTGVFRARAGGYMHVIED